MYYSLVGIVGIIILGITNYEFFLDIKDNTIVKKTYRIFIVAIGLFFVVDSLWGIFWYLKLRTPLLVVTIVYFVFLAFSILLSAKCTVEYLDDNSLNGKILMAIGNFFFLGIVVVSIVNIFIPIMFKIEDDCTFISLPARYVVLGVQVILLIIVSIYALVNSIKSKGILRKKYFSISFFGIIMAICITIQIYKPLIPLYTIGYIIGTCMLHTFIVETEKKEYRINLEKALKHEQEQSKELKEAWSLAYTDALTGVGSKLSYLEIEDKYDKLINEHKLDKFAIAVFDINNLKQVNDTLGHLAGDKYIMDACLLIKETFKNSKVFRIGGDEFIVILDDNDYNKKEELVDRFNKQVEHNLKNNNVVVSIGLATYLENEDYSFGRVADRADALMYERKKYLKSL